MKIRLRLAIPYGALIHFSLIYAHIAATQSGRAKDHVQRNTHKETCHTSTRFT